MNKITGMALATALILTGCGGGSGGGSSAALTTPTSVSGTAAKGIIKHANVLVCKIINGAPESDDSCASTTTGNDGSYRVTFSDGYTGPAMVKVIAGTSSTPSTMLDETTGFDIPYSMTMRAVVPAVSGTTTVYVTPFSEMAASAVSMTTTKIDATTIKQSIEDVQTRMTSLGIDLSVMPIVDLKNSGSDPATLTLQANMVKQLGRVAMAAKTSSLLTDDKGVACNTGTTSSQQIACAVTAMAGVMNGSATYDATTLANMLNTQDVTNISMPILKADGTIGIEIVDMTPSGYTSMQSALQNADTGMPVKTAANTANMMMNRMR